ncbi:MAG: hypothetical protein ACK4NC_00250 [Candidatus Gracilibacteria bacterium]
MDIDENNSWEKSENNETGDTAPASETDEIIEFEDFQKLLSECIRDRSQNVVSDKKTQQVLKLEEEAVAKLEQDTYNSILTTPHTSEETIDAIRNYPSMPEEVIEKLLQSKIHNITSLVLREVMIVHEENFSLLAKVLEHREMNLERVMEFINYASITLEQIKTIVQSRFSTPELMIFIAEEVYISPEVFHYLKTKIDFQKFVKALLTNTFMAKEVYTFLIQNDSDLTTAKRKEFLVSCIVSLTLSEEEYEELVLNSKLVLSFEDRMALKKKYVKKCIEDNNDIDNFS